jgi:Kef-type K+ transport system membrane component KefB
MGVGYLCAVMMGVGKLEAAYMGGGLAESSTLVVLRHLQARKAMFEPYARVVTGVLLLQDVALVLLIIVLSRVDGGGWDVGKGLWEAGVMGGIAWLAQRFVIPKLVLRFKPDEENLLLWLVAVLLGFVGVASWLGLPLIAGAFVGGFVLIKNKTTRTMFDPELSVGMRCRAHCFKRGLIMRAVGDRMIISPPLVMTRAQIDEMMGLIRHCLDATLKELQEAGH